MVGVRIATNAIVVAWGSYLVSKSGIWVSIGYGGGGHDARCLESKQRLWGTKYAAILVHARL